MNDIYFILALTLKSIPAVFLASLGEIITEKGGILNLGLEGIMLVSALAGFVLTYYTHSLIIGFTGAMIVGSSMSLIHAFFSIHLSANQVLSGLAITILGEGLSSFLGRPFIGLQTISLPCFTELEHYPFGIILKELNWIVVASFILLFIVNFILYHTPLGLNLKAIGEDPKVSNAAGLNVFKYRYIATIIGGALTGLGGSYLSLAYTPGWKEGISGGQGWIAIAMVVFSGLKPFRAFVGAFLFGSFMALQFYFQAIGKEIVPVYILKMLPFILPLIILILIKNKYKSELNFPKSLGLPYLKE